MRFYPGRLFSLGSLVLVAGLLLAVRPAAASSWTLENFAGTGAAGNAGDGGPALAAQLDNPFGLVRGPDGCLYVCDYAAHVVRKVDARGVITTVVGTGKRGAAGDGGPAVQAELNDPHEIRFDRRGDLYIADTRNQRVRKVDMKTGLISTVAGTGETGFAGDGGPATRAQFKQPIGIQLDAQDNLFVADIGNHRIRRIDGRTGIITTFAGNGERAPTPDGGPFAGAPLQGPRAFDFDAAGNLWVALREGNQVFKLDVARGTAHHIAGTGAKGFTGNGGPARDATLNGPKGLSVSPDGLRVYLADTENHSIRLIDLTTGRLELIAGSGEKGDGPTGEARAARLAKPHGIFVDRDGLVYVGDADGHRVRVLREAK